MKIKIEGMTCNHCVSAVNQALGAVPGVDRVVEVSLETGEAIIEGSANVAELIAAVEEEGYKAAPVG